jgi:hypothetical protein
MSSLRTRFLKINRIPALLAISCLLLSVAGCRIASRKNTMEGFFKPDKKLATVGRIVFLELGNNTSYPDISSDVTQILYEALQKKQLFSLSIVNKDDPTWQSLGLDSNLSLKLDQLYAIRKELKCDAVLIGTVTTYKPYPHLRIGVRLKLIDARDSQLIWAIEQIWDTTDKSVEERIKRYFDKEKRSEAQNLSQHLVSISSLGFLKFVSYEISDTLRN